VGGAGRHGGTSAKRNHQPSQGQKERGRKEEEDRLAQGGKQVLARCRRGSGRQAVCYLSLSFSLRLSVSLSLSLSQPTCRPQVTGWAVVVVLAIRCGVPRGLHDSQYHLGSNVPCSRLSQHTSSKQAQSRVTSGGGAAATRSSKRGAGAGAELPATLPEATTKPAKLLPAFACGQHSAHLACRIPSSCYPVFLLAASWQNCAQSASTESEHTQRQGTHTSQPRTQNVPKGHDAEPHASYTGLQSAQRADPVV
jgi:hypothetical protein